VLRITGKRRSVFDPVIDYTITSPSTFELPVGCVTLIEILLVKDVTIFYTECTI
jgi:hypothetical protein